MRKVNFLIFGSGAREHAIADKLLQSDCLNKLYFADCNDGFAELGEKIDYSDFDDLARKSKSKCVDIVVVGPENPLCEGITDIFLQYDIKVIGVDKHWSQLESSKYFAKKFMQKHGIKTAKYKLVKTLDDVEFFNEPYVIKADGLCKGKGVTVLNDRESALKTIEECLNGKFGEASEKVLIEEFLGGEEFSLMSLWDGKTLKSFLPARDFKRINESPDSMNTGGMGAFCPVKTDELQQKRLEQYQKRLENALKSERAYFTGFLYSGLVWHEDDFFVLEYNVRLGDPETQAILNVLESDLGEIFVKTVGGELSQMPLQWGDEPAACLTIAAKGYPLEPESDKKITNVPKNSDDIKIYYAGVKKNGHALYSNGGRVLSVCAKGTNPFEKTLKAADAIEMEGKYYRRDLNI